jgi:predicted GNAT family N-acyltransferase
MVRIRRVSSQQQLKRAFAIRMRVFVREQGVSAEIELDRDDMRATHLLALVPGKAVGTARIVIRSGNAKIGRMAVLKKFRRRGVGTKLLNRAIVTAETLGAKKIYLHALFSLIGFYETMGFRCAGGVFDEAGIPHRKMTLADRKNRRSIKS